VAKRFGQRLDYQIWPEPNIVQNWKGNPRQMAVLTMVAARAIERHAGQGATVVSPAVAVRLPSQQRWMIDYFRQRVGGHRVHSYVDAVAVDPFPEASGTPEDSSGGSFAASGFASRCGPTRSTTGWRVVTRSPAPGSR
jgi:hypothetical protein